MRFRLRRGWPLRVEPLEERHLLNAAPTDILLPLASVMEQQPAVTAVGKFASVDPDARNTFTYSLVAGAGSTDNASFTIGALGDLLTAATFDSQVKSAYSIRVRSTDQGNLWVEKAFTVTVTPLAGRRVDLVSTAILSSTGNTTSRPPSISGDGRYVVFASDASNLVVGDTNGCTDIFVKDRVTGGITRVSTDSSGQQGNNAAESASISSDGRYVAFASSASNLVADDTNGCTDIFIKDLLSGTTTRVSTDDAEIQGNDASSQPCISSDGQYVAFTSSANNLVAGDYSSYSDVFVKARVSGAITLASTDGWGFHGNGNSSSASISSDGRYVAFASYATNLAASADTNATSDVFVKDLVAGTTTRVSTSSSDGQGNYSSEIPSISGDGRYVAFASYASNLVVGDTNYCTDIFVKDLASGVTTRVNTDSLAGQANNNSAPASISPDGRYVAFASYASNLVSDDTNSSADIFLKDLVSGATTRVSTDNLAGQANSDSYAPWISGDGRYVAFGSYASNLAAGDTNGCGDIFVKDLTTGAVDLGSARIAGVPSTSGGGSDSYSPSINGDGQFVAFSSSATNLLSGDANGSRNIFIKDLFSGGITLVSTNSSAIPGNGFSDDASINGDGRYVAFQSDANNLVDDDTSWYTDIFVKDLLWGITTRVSTDSSAAEANNDSRYPSLSGDGRYVTFQSDASNLVASDTNWYTDIFVKDLLSGNTTLVSVDSSANQGNASSTYPSLSGDGRYVAFQSEASNLVAGDTNGCADIFVKNLISGSITRVSTDSSAAQGNNYSYYPSLSSDGRYVAFQSEASNLVAGDTNGCADIFIKDLISGITRRVSTDSSAGEANGSSDFPSVSGDGRYVTFASLASNLVAADTYGTNDIFVKDLVSGVTTRVSADSAAVQGNAPSYYPSISGDGRYVTFGSSASNLHPWDTTATLDVFRVSNFDIDRQKPTVESLSPPDNAANVAVDTNLVLTFSEPVQKGAGTLLVKKSDGSTVESLDVASSRVTIVNATATIDPALTLAETTGYYVEVANGAFVDLAGNPFNGLSGATTWNFTTGDFTSPGVTINQAAGQADPTTGAPLNFTVVFSEAVGDFSAGDITLGGTVSGTLLATVSGSGTTYNVSVSGMTGNGTVIAGILAGVAHDAAGNANRASTSTDNVVYYGGDAAGNTLGTARDLGVLGATAVVVNDFVGSSDTDDYYRFQIPLDGPVTISVSGLTADLDLQLVSDTGSILGSVSHVGTTDEIVTAVFGGNWPYYLRVYCVSGDTGYTLSLIRGGTTGFDTAGSSVGTARNLGSLSASAAEIYEYVGSADTDDYFRFQQPGEGPVTVSVSGLNANVDLQWLSDTGSVLGTVSHAGTTDEVATATFSGNWPYYLRVYSLGGNTNYTLSLTRGGVAAFDTAGNNRAAARDLGSIRATASEMYEYVGSTDTEDYYCFRQPGEGPVTVSVSGLSADVDLQWLSDTGTVLGTVSHTGTTDEIATATFGPNWPYYLRVYSLGGNTNYTLSLSRGGLATFDTAGNNIATARDLGNIRATASEMYEYVGSADTDDYYCFRQPGEGPVTVSVSGLSADIDLQWLSDTGTVLGTVSHAGTTDEIATATFGPNWPYYLRVYSLGGNTNYTLALSRGGLATFDTAGNNIAAARDLGNLRASASEMYEYVGSADTDDYYCFRQAAEGPVTVSVSGLSADVDLQWLSDTGAVLGTVSHAGITDEVATATFGGNWPYYLRVYRVNGNTNYTLSLSRGGTATFDTAGNSLAAARDLGNITASAAQVIEYVGASDTQDYFCFRQPASGLVTITLSGLSANADLQVLTDTGTVVASRTMGGAANETIALTFGGNWPYYIRVYQASGNTNYTLSLTKGASLLAADAPVVGALGSVLADQSVVAPVMQAALLKWESQGQPLRLPRVVVTDLPGAELGRAVDGTIYLDRDAAGHGWFIDPTPAVDEEFARLGTGTHLTALDARAADKIDLLTVIEHELGHWAGLYELDVSATSLMSGALPNGVRRAVTAGEVDAVFAAQGASS